MRLQTGEPVYLLSFPCSGNHWVRFIVEYVTGRPTLGCAGSRRDVPIHENRFAGGANPLAHVRPEATPALQKVHFADELTNKAVATLLFIVRDYRECIVGHMRYQENERLLMRYIIKYLANLSYFDSFEGTKQILKYENLLSDPASEVDRIAMVIPGCEEQYLAKFRLNSAELERLSATATGRFWAGVRSNRQVSYHFGKVGASWQATVRRHFLSILERSYPSQARHVEDYID